MTLNFVGKERIRGSQTGIPHSFEFNDDEKVTSMGMSAGDRVNRIFFVTDGGCVFDQKGEAGTRYDDFIGNSILLGFTGSFDAYGLLSLGTVFKDLSD
jgi:hypothetical protein